MPVHELKEMLANDKKDKGITGKAKKVVLSSVLGNEILYMDSLSACVKYFKDLGYTTSSNTLVSRIKSGKEYNGYLVKFSEDQTSSHHRAKFISITSMVTGITHTYNSLRDAEANTNI